MPDTPERWRVDAGAADVATLVVPPALRRERVFDIDVRLLVRVIAAAEPAWLSLQVEVDGRHEWSRRIDAAPPSDSLDHHCRRALAPGQALRVRALAQVGRARHERLTIDVQESGDKSG